MAATAVMMSHTPITSHFLPALSWNLGKGTRRYCRDQRKIPSSDLSRRSSQRFPVRDLPICPNYEATGYFLGKELPEEVSAPRTPDTTTVGSYRRPYIRANYQAIYKDSRKRMHVPSSSKYTVTRPVKPHQYVLGILNANRKIHKRTDTDVAFTREYSKVSIFHRERECTN